MVTRGDSRISVQVARNKHTVALGRENRFLIDDPESPHKLAYILSKPFKTGLVYQGTGTFKFVLQEVTATEDDNHELGIADYYKHFPKDNKEGIPPEEKKEDERDLDVDPVTPEEREVWI